MENKMIRGADVGATVVAQDLYEISATQMQRLGTRLQRGDRVFRYVKAIATLTSTKLLVRSYYHQHISYAAINAASPAGSNKVYVTSGSGDGIANDGTFAAHALEGGYIAIFDASTDEWLNYAILDNDAAVSAGKLTITIDGELPIALTTSDHVEAMCSPYLITGVNTQDRYCFMGLPLRLLTTTYPYGWIQTWGPCWVNPQPLVGVNGPSKPNMVVVARHDGSIDLPVYNDTNVAYAQRVGHVMTIAQDGTQGAPFINLQIMP